MIEKQSTVSVFCRMRPLKDEHIKKISYNIEDGRIINLERNKVFKGVNSKDSTKQFVFEMNKVYHDETQQASVFDTCAKNTIDKVLEGFDGAIIAYGQTGSGKTHTMIGEDDEQQGVIPRTVDYIFEAIGNDKYQGSNFFITASFFEIYNEKVIDLMDPINKSNLKLRGPKDKYFIEFLTEINVSDPDELKSIFESSIKNRTISSTKMNSQSSRSHYIMALEVRQETQNATLTSKLHLVDLAGSEKIDKSKVKGSSLSETLNINKSLSALSHVIKQLSEAKPPNFRNSVLTKILQSSFGGSSYTSIILTCSVDIADYNETISSLRFGINAKSVKNNPKINKKESPDELKRTIETLKRTISDMQIIKEDPNSDDDIFSNSKISETIDNLKKEAPEIMLKAVAEIIGLDEFQGELLKIRFKELLSESMSSLDSIGRRSSPSSSGSKSDKCSSTKSSSSKINIKDNLIEKIYLLEDRNLFLLEQIEQLKSEWISKEEEYQEEIQSLRSGMLSREDKESSIAALVELREELISLSTINSHLVKENSSKILKIKNLQHKIDFLTAEVSRRKDWNTQLIKLVDKEREKASLISKKYSEITKTVNTRLEKLEKRNTSILVCSSNNTTFDGAHDSSWIQQIHTKVNYIKKVADKSFNNQSSTQNISEPELETPTSKFFDSYEFDLKSGSKGGTAMKAIKGGSSSGKVLQDKENIRMQF